MEITFYLAAAVAIAATIMVIVGLSAMHALLYLIVSLLAIAVVFYVLGAPFAAALEVIVYAGAIMVLFVFVVMMLNLGQDETLQQRRWITPRLWIGPAVLSAILALLLGYVLFAGGGEALADRLVDSKQVGIALYGPY